MSTQRHEKRVEEHASAQERASEKERKREAERIIHKEDIYQNSRNSRLV